MSSLRERLVDNFPAVRAVLAGVVRSNSNRYYSKHLAEILQPLTKSRPCSITDRFSQFPVSDHIPHLQVLVGNQVVRLDDASCQLHGKIFTLPTYLEVLSTQAISRLSSVFRAFLGSRKSATKTLECFFRLPQCPWIFNSFTIRVGVEVSQPNVQSNSLTCWFSLFYPFNIKAKLGVVPISATNNTDALNLAQLTEVQIASSPQLEASSFKTVDEGDSSSILRQLPATGLVLNRTVCLMFFKVWETLMTRLTLLAVVVEPSNCKPCPFSRCLTSHRVELVCPRKFFGKDSAISTQVVPSNSLVIPPVFDATVADETCSTNGFIKPLILLFRSLKFCLKYKHLRSQCPV